MTAEKLIKKRIDTLINESRAIETELVKSTEVIHEVSSKITAMQEAKTPVNEEVKATMKLLIEASNRNTKLTKTLDNNFHKIKELVSLTKVLGFELELKEENAEILTAIISNAEEHFILLNGKVEEVKITAEGFEEALDKLLAEVLESYLDQYGENIKDA